MGRSGSDHPRRRPPRPHPDQRGNAATEFALLLPVIVMVVVLALTGGQLVSSGIGLVSTSRAAVVAAANNPDAAGGLVTPKMVDAATAAANSEQGAVITCPSGRCVQVAMSVGTSSSRDGYALKLVTVTISETVRPFALMPATVMTHTATAHVP